MCALKQQARLKPLATVRTAGKPTRRTRAARATTLGPVQRYVSPGRRPCIDGTVPGELFPVLLWAPPYTSPYSHPCRL
jgi:hypothetical protein